MKRENQIPVLLGFLGILAAIVVFFFVYRPYVEKTQALESQNIELLGALSKYQEIAENEEYYRETIGSYQEDTRTVISEYAYGLIREDQIMYIANLENRFGRDIQVNYFNMGDDMEIPYGAEGTAEAVDAAAADAANVTQTSNSFQEPVPVDNGIRMFENPIEFGYEASYEGIKDILDYISGVGTKKNITSVNLTFNSTNGMLNGSIHMNQYYLTGTDGAYATTTIPSMQIGVENIFGTIDVDLEDDAEVTAEE